MSPSTIYRYTMLRSRSVLIHEYGKAFWQSFRQLSARYFREVRPQVPDIGKSIFSLNYQFLPAYVAWYRAFSDLKLSPEEIDRNIWMMNDRMVSNVPRWLSKAIGRQYYQSFQQKAASHLERQAKNQSHPLDWKIEYRKLSEEAFEIDILSCPFQQLSGKLGAAGLLFGAALIAWVCASGRARFCLRARHFVPHPPTMRTILRLAVPGVQTVAMAVPNPNVDTAMIQVIPTTGPDDPATEALLVFLEDRREYVEECPGAFAKLHPV